MSRVVPLRLNVKAINVPLELLFSKDLTPAGKFLWIRLRMDELRKRPRSHASRKLTKRTGLARSTIMLALKRLESTGWLVRTSDRARRKLRWKTAHPVKNSGYVRIPIDLIRDIERIRPQEVLFYGYLQATPTFDGLAGKFKWDEIRDLTGLHLRTIRRAVRGLADAFWLALKQENRLSPIEYRLQHADEARMKEIDRRLERRIRRSAENHVGEALMHEELGLIIATDKCTEGARQEFLVNPATAERLELDRYYPNHNVAFEFNGRQHDTATGRFSKEEVAAQKKRDAVGPVIGEVGRTGTASSHMTPAVP